MRLQVPRQVAWEKHPSSPGPDTLIPRQVLFGNPEKANPQLSPDGQAIAYLAPVNRVLNVWLMDRSGSNPRQLAFDNDRGVVDYTWSVTRTLMSNNPMFFDVYSCDLETGELSMLQASFRGSSGFGKGFLERSPINSVQNTGISMFVARGASDPRAVKTESDQMVEANQGRRPRSHICGHENEGHGFVIEANRLDSAGGIQEATLQERPGRRLQALRAGSWRERASGVVRGRPGTSTPSSLPAGQLEKRLVGSSGDKLSTEE
jgi:hypothetical protein